MFVPITSEINIQTGQVLKELSTGTLFRVGIWREPNSWEIEEIAPETQSRIVMVADRQTLAMKFFAETEDE